MPAGSTMGAKRPGDDPRVEVPVVTAPFPPRSFGTRPRPYQRPGPGRFDILNSGLDRPWQPPPLTGAQQIEEGVNAALGTATLAGGLANELNRDAQGRPPRGPGGNLNAAYNQAAINRPGFTLPEGTSPNDPAAIEGAAASGFLNSLRGVADFSRDLFVNKVQNELEAAGLRAKGFRGKTLTAAILDELDPVPRLGSSEESREIERQGQARAFGVALTALNGVAIRILAPDRADPPAMPGPDDVDSARRDDDREG